MSRRGAHKEAITWKDLESKIKSKYIYGEARLPYGGGSTVLHGSFSIDTFDPSTTDWKRWLQRFVAATKIFKIPEDHKAMYLLHFIGSATFNVICNKLALADPYAATFETRSLAEFYAPEPLEIAENFQFYQCKQQEGESVKKIL